MYTVMNVLHVVTAVFLIGPMAILPMSALRFVRAGNGPAVARSARSTMIFSVASLAVVIFGFGLIEAAPDSWELSLATSWILISIIVYAVAVALSLFGVVPALRSVAEHLEEAAQANPAAAAFGAAPAATAAQANEPDAAGEITTAGAVRRNDYRRIAMTSGLVSLLLLTAVVLMVVRP